MVTYREAVEYIEAEPIYKMHVNDEEPPEEVQVLMCAVEALKNEITNNERRV